MWAWKMQLTFDLCCLHECSRVAVSTTPNLLNLYMLYQTCFYSCSCLVPQIWVILQESISCAPDVLFMILFHISSVQKQHYCSNRQVSLLWAFFWDLLQKKENMTPPQSGSVDPLSRKWWKQEAPDPEFEFILYIWSCFSARCTCRQTLQQTQLVLAFLIQG